MAEFTLVLPIFLILLISSFYGGWAMYAASSASQAIQEPIFNKLTLAGQSGNTAPQVSQLVQGFQLGGLPIPGQPLDTLSIVNTDRVTALLVGQKTMTVPLLGAQLPFQFTVVQPINSQLLLANGTQSRTGSLFQTHPGVVTLPALPLATLYGLDPNLKSFPLSSPNCQLAEALTADRYNQLFPNETQALSAYTPPAGYAQAFEPDSAGEQVTPTEFLATTILAQPNTFCDSTDSQVAFQQACTLEAEETTSFLPPTEDPATTEATAASTTAPAEVTTVASPCVMQKMQACRLQLANRYFLASRQVLLNQGSCTSQAIGVGNDAPFPQTTPQY